MLCCICNMQRVYAYWEWVREGAQAAAALLASPKGWRRAIALRPTGFARGAAAARCRSADS